MIRHHRLIAGYWTGTSGVDENNLISSTYVLFRNDGTFRIYFANADTTIATKANGTYTTSLPGTVNGTYKFVDNSQESLEALLTANFLEMKGSTGTGVNTTGISVFELQKQQ